MSLPIPARIGVAAATAPVSESTTGPNLPTIFSQFAMHDRVVIVTGGNRGIGLETAMALCEAGARVVVCIDLPEQPSEDWEKTKKYLDNMETNPITAIRPRLEYISADVTDQQKMWDVVEKIAEREKRMDCCVACAGVLSSNTSCLEVSSRDFKKIMDVNVDGVFFSAQAAARQMVKWNTPGSIILIASMSGSITNKDQPWVAYNTSKAAVLQMSRSMACELGAKKIRVNSLSPGYIYTAMTAGYLNSNPDLRSKWASENPLGRIGSPEELRGVVTWLASDASSFTTGSDIIVDGGHRAW